MVCKMDSVAIPRPPALPQFLNDVNPSSGIKSIVNRNKIKNDLTKNLPFIMEQNRIQNRTESTNSKPPSNGFRLMEDQGDKESIYSTYKQKIDAMFDSDTSSKTKNSVQARIEKMFTDVAHDNGISIESGIGLHLFSVDYLGSVPLQGKVTSLTGLQSPLRSLYFAYKKMHKSRKALTGRLEISSQGLKVQYQADGGDLGQINSFSTIAVWSAVKFVIHESHQASYAFLPLITDPDNIDKQSLFRNLDENEKQFITNDYHSPLFAVVMRKFGVQKQLECHGFVCQTSEDAIVIAATLYKSLMSHMKLKEKKPKNKNGIGCMSIASSSFNDKATNNSANPTPINPVRPPRKKRSSTSSISDPDRDPLGDCMDTQPLLQNPSKPPKKSIKTRRAPKAPSETQQDLDAILPYEEPIFPPPDNNNNKTEEPAIEIKPASFSDKINTFMSREQKQITAEIKQVMSVSSTKGLKKVPPPPPPPKPSEENIRNNENSGDILTKVTIPRSGSFLNAGGLTRYKSKISRSNGQASGGSPLGFHELFNEFRLQEGLHSMDEILGVIIDPNGMSFNDLKPIYKEFLLKLSVTLTKDELYQRSKTIMRRQKRKLIKQRAKNHNGPNSAQTKRKRNFRVGKKFKQLKHIFQRSSKNKKEVLHHKSMEQLIEQDEKPAESSLSSTSYDTGHFRPKEDVRKQANKKKNRKHQRASTSEESDFLSMRRKKVLNSLSNHRNSSSGYVSCSDCSYDSDTCTCTTDKCYCSLGHNKNVHPKSKHLQNCTRKNCADKCYCTIDPTLTFCSCDTDSCADSNKCYCQGKGKNIAILAQLKHHGIIPTNTSKSKKHCKRNSNTKSTKSLEYIRNTPCDRTTPCTKMQMISRPNSRLGPPEEGLSSRRKRNELLATLENDLCSLGMGTGRSREHLHNVASAYGLGKTINDVTTGQMLMDRHGSVKSFNSARLGEINFSFSRYGSRHESLSIKKSQEIAAAFADLNIQPNDIRRSNRSLQNGYHITNHNNTHAGTKPPLCKSNKSFLHHSSDVSSKQQNHHSKNHYQGFNATNNGTQNGLFNTKNGLYTIQSQSDESGRSSFGERRESRKMRKGDKVEYFELDPKYTQVCKNSASNSLENSLGYLP